MKNHFRQEDSVAKEVGCVLGKSSVEDFFFLIVSVLCEDYRGQKKKRFKYGLL